MNSLEFKTLFHINDSEDNIILWDSDHVGITILRDYPGGLLFKPSTTLDGKQDSVIMIKIGWAKTRSSDVSKILLHASVSKQSRYFINQKTPFYHHSNPSCPTKESLIISENTAQPLDLEYDNYFFSISSFQFFDNEKLVNGSEIIDKLFNDHIASARSIIKSPFWGGRRIYQRYLQGQDNIIHLVVDWEINLTKGLLKSLFGRELQKKDGEIIGQEFYSDFDLIPSTPNKITIFGLETNVTKNSFLSYSIVLVILYLFNPYFGINCFGLELFCDQIENMGEIITGALILVSLNFFDILFPKVLLYCLNSSIKKRRKLLWGS